MQHKYLTYSADEVIFYKRKKYIPNYSSKNSLKIFNTILSKILKKKKLISKIYFKDYNLLSVALEDFFWQYCFNYSKYQNFIKLNGLEIKSKENLKNKSFIKGYDRIKNYLNGNANFKNFIKKNVKISLFYFWVIFNFFNKEKILVDKYFFEDFRYQNLKLKKKNFIVIPFALDSLKLKSTNVEDAIINDLEAKLLNYKKWIFAIKFLKIKKIILQDNAYNNFSLLLAAKITKIKCEAISHAVNLNNHMNIMGSNIFKKKKMLLFDKIYVYSKEFLNLINKKSYFYNKESLEVIGWINNRNYNFNIKKFYSKKYILYPFEHFCNFKKINKILLFFSKKKHTILVKTRPDMMDYKGYFDDEINIKYVKNYTKKHIENSLCAIGSTTSMLFNLSQNCLPIIFLNNDGFNYFDGLKLPKNCMKIKDINEKIYKIISKKKTKKSYKLPQPKNKIIN